MVLTRCGYVFWEVWRREKCEKDLCGWNQCLTFAATSHINNLLKTYLPIETQLLEY